MAHGDGGVPEAGGVDLQPDVERIHRAIRREPHDPIEGQERAPWFFVATVALALFWGGWYLGRYGGAFNTSSHIALSTREPGIVADAAAQNAKTLADPVATGQAIYQRHCVSCHQSSGRGVPGAFPPLVGSEWVTGAPEPLIRILLHGLQGPITVAGADYNGVMPAWQEVLQDAEIAALATYLRQWEGNDAPGVDVALVTGQRSATASRTTAYTATELATPGAAPAPPAGSPPAASPPAAASAAAPPPGAPGPPR
ncbi:MAG: cytochrome c [Gemmatimonadota bacterium]